ncbi:MAG TPA: copper-binding protein, partial [Nitrosopumilaceae archaeon]|nr:copper-binding protein [Nitrosopumilaceae archaeon]
NAGFITITMPRVLIDSKNGIQDDKFVVLLDQREVSFNESKTSSERTVTIQFPMGSEQIEIMGTKVFPSLDQLSAYLS